MGDSEDQHRDRSGFVEVRTVTRCVERARPGAWLAPYPFIAGAPAFGAATCLTCRRFCPQAQAKPPLIRACREQKRQQAGAVQTLARDAGRVQSLAFRDNSNAYEVRAINARALVTIKPFWSKQIYRTVLLMQLQWIRIASVCRHDSYSSRSTTKLSANQRLSGRSANSLSLERKVLSSFVPNRV